MASSYIDRFEVIAELGRGGMATVYHAHDPDFKRDVAIKIMPREFLHVPDFKTRFQREARTIAALEHDAIVPVYELGEHDDLPFLVMRYMGGGSLADRIEREPLAVPEAVDLFKRIAPAIDLAHAQGFVHRDLKPDNILFDHSNHAFIADFGIAKLMHSTSQLTGSGALVGTPAYMSPEQIQDKGEVDHRSDLYSLGVILYEVLTGQMPFKVDSSVGYFSAHLNDPVPDILDDNPALPPLFSSIIYRAMAKNKDERYQSAADLAADIAHALDDDVYFDDYHTLTTHAPPTRRMPIYPLIGVGALIMLGLVALLLSGVLSGNKQGAGEQPETLTVLDTASATPTDLPAPTATDAPTVVPSPTTNSLLAELADAGTIAYTSGIGANFDIYTIRADGRDKKQLTIDSAWECCSVWSDDGSQIFFTSDRDGDDDLFIMDADGSNLTKLFETDTDDLGAMFSTLSDRLLYHSIRDSYITILTSNIDGTNPLQVTADQANSNFGHWSPDGNFILFESNSAGSDDIYIVDKDGSNLVRLTFGATANERQPNWSPDGTQIVYVSEVRDPMARSTIYVLDLETRTETAITPEQSLIVTGMGWSPDGRYVAYGACIEQSTSCSLYVVSLETLDQVRIVRDGINPDWRPMLDN